ncbi:hypothetical protein UlMin_032397 [Ulmus minor]
MISQNFKNVTYLFEEKKRFYILICNTFVFYRCVDNKAELEQLTLKKSYVGSSSSAIKAPASHEIIEVKDIQSLEEKQTTFWLQAKIYIPHLNQKYWYMACNKCYRRTNIDYKQTFDCVHCAEKQARAMPRCLLEVQVSDKTGALIATLFGENAEKFICCLAETLMQNLTEDGVKNKDKLMTIQTEIEFLVCLKIRKLEISGGAQYKYSILNMLNALPEPTVQSNKEASSSTIQHVTGECFDQFFDAANTNLQMTNSLEILPEDGDENSQIIDFDNQQ